MDQQQLNELNNAANLRDHFAGIAMQSIINSEHHMEAADALTKVLKIEIQDAISMLAYTQADSMLNVRNRPDAEQKKSSNRKIKIEALDPLGQTLGQPLDLDYYELGWENSKKPEEYPQGQEPMKVVRYLLTIGDHQYFLKRDGQIYDQITRKEE